MCIDLMTSNIINLADLLQKQLMLIQYQKGCSIEQNLETHALSLKPMELKHLFIVMHHI